MNNTRICTTCEQTLDIINFHHLKNGGYMSICKHCNSKRTLRYHASHRKERLEYMREYITKNRDRINTQRRQNTRNLKLDILNHYTNGNIHCQCPSGQCTETHVEFMTIDHINGGGTKHRASLNNGNPSGYVFYYWLKKNNYPSGFRVLCWNCNCSIGHYKKCPHERE